MRTSGRLRLIFVVSCFNGWLTGWLKGAYIDGNVVNGLTEGAGVLCTAMTATELQPYLDDCWSRSINLDLTGSIELEIFFSNSARSSYFRPSAEHPSDWIC